MERNVEELGNHSPGLVDHRARSRPQRLETQKRYLLGKLKLVFIASGQSFFNHPKFQKIIKMITDPVPA